MARRISSETRLKARLTATVIAMILALASPVLIPMATATYNERFVPSSIQPIYYLNDRTTNALFNPNNNASAQLLHVEELHYNGSVLMDLTGHSRYPVDIDGTQKVEHLLVGQVPPSITVTGEENLTLQFNVFNDMASMFLPMYPNLVDENGNDVSVPRGYKYSYYAVYIGCSLSYNDISAENQVNGVLSIDLQFDQGYPSCTKENIDTIRIGFMDESINYYYGGTNVDSYTRTLAPSTNKFIWNVTLSELASIARDKAGSNLWIALYLEPWTLYADGAPGIGPASPFSLVVNLTATALRGPYTIPYMEATNAGIGITGAVLFGCGAVIVSNIPATRTYVYNRKKYRIVASSDLEVNEYAKERYLQNRGGG